VTLAIVALGLATTCGITSARWIGKPFPGFFIMANRVIASISLPHWPIAAHSHLYQHVVIAVNDHPVTSSHELYTTVRNLPTGSSITYTLEKDGQLVSVTLPSITFTIQDYFLLFGVYLLNGLALVLIGVSVWLLAPSSPASLALLAVGLAGGFFALTAADLYGPHWFFRLHVVGEAFFPAGFIHVALVFPVDRFRRHRRWLLVLPYCVALALAILYQMALYQPAAYSFIHNLCMDYVGIAGATLLSAVLWDYHTTDSYLTQQRIFVVLLGFLSGYAFPTILMTASGITGGQIAVNYAGFTAFFFPLSLGYAIVKHDLFEIDAMLKRGAYYLALTATLTCGYLAFLGLLQFALRSSPLAHSQVFPLFFTLIVALLLNPLKELLQQGIDRVFFRLQYNPKRVLERTSAFLASTLRLEEILAFIWRTIGENLGLTQEGIFLYEPTSTEYVRAYPPATSDTTRFPASHPLIQTARQRKERVFSLPDTLSATGTEASLLAGDELAALNLQLLVPLVLKDELIGLIVLGKKESGAFFSADDHDFLYTLANQSVVSIANARAYQAIQEFNTALEQKVDERTQELALTNEELQASLLRLEQAYRDLQRSQENLLRAEKMAALGRLAAGIAHEMNTPLGASLTSLKLLQELTAEYQVSIDDPTVDASDHHDIAAEMDRLVRATQQWVEKAAAHIRSLKTHTRDLQRGEARPFSVLQVIEDTGLLLSHRLRLAQCSLIVSCSATNPILYGDPGKLGQVLTNLIVNAIDAYHGTKSTGGEIAVQVSESNGYLEIRVRDHGSGIPADHLERIFEEFFSTKPLGEGTGLGLSLAHNIVTNFFGGAISVNSELGHGSEFLLQLPRLNPTERDQGKEFPQTATLLGAPASAREASST
jgi:signal transduction histidine kinase